MVLGTQPGVWVPPAPPAWARSAKTINQRPPQHEALMPLPLRQLQQQHQEQVDQLAREYRLAQKRVRDEDDASRTKMLKECADAKAQARQEVQLACRGLARANVEGQLSARLKQIDIRRQQLEGSLQAQLSAELAQLHALVHEEEKAMGARHLAEKVQLAEEQEASQVKDEAEEVWQWILDCFDGHADKSPLFRCFPLFDSARHDRRKLYDFVRMAQLELGWTMDWKMPDVVA